MQPSSLACNMLFGPSLEDTRRWVRLDDNRMPTLMGKYKVPHFDAKGDANHLFTDLGVPTTFLLTSFFGRTSSTSGRAPREGRTVAITVPIGDRKLPGTMPHQVLRHGWNNPILLQTMIHGVSQGVKMEFA